MLVIVGITASVLFLILWRSGFLDDLMKRGSARRGDHWRQERKQIEDVFVDHEMAKRLEVFEEFMEELPDDEEEE